METPTGQTPGRGSAEIPTGDGFEPRALVRLALLFYGLMFAAAAALATLFGDTLLFASAESVASGVNWLRDPLAGAATAAVLIALSRQLTDRTNWGQRLARTLGRTLGSLSAPQCVVLAAASGVAEEALFRGALQPQLGLIGASLLFGLAHFAPRRDLWPWSLLSIAAGFLLGGLFEATGNLIAPVVAHAGINAVNLRYLARRYGGAS